MLRASWGASVPLCWRVALRLLEPFAWAHQNQKSLRIYISLKQPLTNDWQVQWYKYPCSLTPIRKTMVTHTLSPEMPGGTEPKLLPTSPPPWTLRSTVLPLGPFLSLLTDPLPFGFSLEDFLINHVQWILISRVASREPNLRWQLPRGRLPEPLQRLWHWPSSLMQRALYVPPGTGVLSILTSTALKLCCSPLPLLHTVVLKQRKHKVRRTHQNWERTILFCCQLWISRDFLIQELWLEASIWKHSPETKV